MQILISRSGLVLNPGQMADLVLAWRQVAGLIASIPADRPMVDDLAYSFRLPPPGPAGGAPSAATPKASSPKPKAPAPAAPARKQASSSKPKRKAAAKPARKTAARRGKSRR